MEENILKALSYFSVAFFIIIAISLFFSLYGSNSEMINIINRNNISEQGPVYRTNNYEQSESKVSGAVIIGCIKNGLETDISIDSVIVHKDMDINMFDFGIVDIAALYSVEYDINPSGEVTFVKYQKSGGDR